MHQRQGGLAFCALCCSMYKLGEGGLLVKACNALFAVVCLFAGTAVSAAASADEPDKPALSSSTGHAATLPIDLAARLFGARPSASAPDLSPNGDKVVFIQAGTGSANVVRLLDLKTKQTSDIIASTGKPDFDHILRIRKRRLGRL